MSATAEQMKEELDRRKDREVESLRRRQKKGRVSVSEYNNMIDNLHRKYQEMEAQGLDLDIHVDVKFGMDRETDKKMKLKQSGSDYKQAESDITDWLEDISGTQIEDLYEELKRGALLWKIIEAVWGPQYLPRQTVWKMKGKAAMSAFERNQIKIYLETCGRLGVVVFGIEDLYSEKDLNAVFNNLRAVKKLYDFNLELRQKKEQTEKEKEKQPVPEEPTVLNEAEVEVEWKEETLEQLEKEQPLPTPGVDHTDVQRSYLSYERVANSTMFVVALFYFLGFLSLWNQIPLLWGRDGLRSLDMLLDQKQQLLQGADTNNWMSQLLNFLTAFYRFPSVILWTHDYIRSDIATEAVCLLGMALSLCAATFRHGFMFSPKINFSLLWLLYLSLATITRTLELENAFDKLLLEIGFLTTLLATSLSLPLRQINRLSSWPKRYVSVATKPIVIHAIRWTVFKLLITSAIEMLQSNTPMSMLHESSSCVVTQVLLASSQYPYVEQSLSIWSLITEGILSFGLLWSTPYVTFLYRLIAFNKLVVMVLTGNINLVSSLLIGVLLALYSDTSLQRPSKIHKVLSGLFSAVLLLASMASAIQLFSNETSTKLLFREYLSKDFGLVSASIWALSFVVVIVLAFITAIKVRRLTPKLGKVHMIIDSIMAIGATIIIICTVTFVLTIFLCGSKQLANLPVNVEEVQRVDTALRHLSIVPSYDSPLMKMSGKEYDRLVLESSSSYMAWRWEELPLFYRQTSFATLPAFVFDPSRVYCKLQTEPKHAITKSLIAKLLDSKSTDLRTNLNMREGDPVLYLRVSKKAFTVDKHILSLKESTIIEDDTYSSSHTEIQKILANEARSSTVPKKERPQYVKLIEENLPLLRSHVNNSLKNVVSTIHDQLHEWKDKAILYYTQLTH
eukprot:TRINITY_DN3683_c0_g1_i1.p1 TRINITY_DN3683_c0_g1~~TRINITY_DN3683_c0_g1_i1.p1  ORF type:complete len:917 (-),score=205.65 TRINITY_DN3683_c0_g1_i1:101-2812(-)